MIDTSESHMEASSMKTSLLDTKTKLQIGTWNVRTMFDTAKTAQVINEIKSYKLHILGISESKKGMEGTLIEWKPVSARMLRARFFDKHSKLTIIQCYSPTNDAEPEEKEAFYSMLEAEKERVPAHDVLIIMSDPNAKVGSDNVGRERTVGRQGCGQHE